MTTPADSDTKWLNRIRALLAKAEDPAATPEEAETFLAKATELIAKFGIDQALLAAKEPERDHVGDRIVVVHAPYARHTIRFLNAIAEALGVRGIRRRSTAKGTEELHLFGMKSDLARVDLLFTSLLVQSANAMAYAFDRDQKAWGNSRKWKSDFIEGFTSVVRQRLTEAEQRAQRQAQQERTDGGPSVALVLVSRMEMVDRRVGEVYANLRKPNKRRFKISTGYGAGRTAGTRADLGGTRVQAGSRQALSR